MRPLPLALTSLCLAAFAPAAAAGGLYDATFKGGNRCYSRTYDKAHLKAHPRQTVSGIQLAYTASNDDGTPNKPDAFEIGLSFSLKKADGWFSGPATCKTLGDRFSCFLEGDGGQFTLTPKAGALMLAVVNRGGGGY
jgi:hypothetical protein